MKKTIMLLITLMLVIVSILTFAFTENIYVDIQKSVHANKDYIPLRKTFEGLGYTVTWQSKTRMVEIEKDNNIVYVRADDQYLLRDGVLVDGMTPPIIINGRMYLSLETVGQIFESYSFVTTTTIRFYDGLKGLNGELPKLKSKAEYEKLMSFYPNQLAYDKIFIEDMPMTGMETLDEVREAEEDVSETNTQVEGVDEADIVKIDANYIYALRDEKLQVITTGRNNLKVLHTIQETGFYPQQFFITSDKLVLIGNETRTEILTYEEGNRIMIAPVYKPDALMIKCYDIKNLENEAPKLIKSFGVEGDYLSARLVEDYVYIVANQYAHYLDPIMPILLEGDAENQISSSEIGYEELSYFPGHVNNNIVYTIGINLNNLTLEGLDVDAYIGGGNILYADKDTLYLTMQTNSSMWWRDWNESTDIFSFNLYQGTVDFKTKGNVPGYIINQFAMDEYNDHFRIATTRWGSEDVGLGNTTLNNLYILDQDLNQTGAVENLAPGETIYSTRMIEDKVYMVTYRQVDPFYVIDTSNPIEPEVMGYLKIPGYSSYLHPYDDQTIIGVGMETEIIGGRVVNSGVKISLFDVSDFKNPVEKDKIILGNGNSSTDVSYDHKAFLFNKEKNILAIPVRVISDNYVSYSNDAYIFNFTEEGMLNFKGMITHNALAENVKTYYDYNDSVTRIMYIGNDLYTLSNNWLKLNDFESLKLLDVLRR
ncbi:MAG: beta-propeller domain-containing protein [Clostridiales bacterium]|nr:beta-propeller domain-containing protein [Clostridiales bacterium]